MGMTMNPHKLLPVLLSTALCLAACGNNAQETGAADDDDGPAIPVETTLPSRSDIYATYSGTAPIEAYADATVIAKVSGEVREVMAEEGDDVVTGQVLARLDGERLRLEMQQAEANLQKLQRDYQRNLDLKGRNLISEGDFEKIRFEMDALQATYDLARLELGYTEIRAPISGVVSERFIKIGNTIDANEQTFKVTSLEPLISYLHVPEREYRRIDPGQRATIQIDALQGIDFPGTVARISPVVDPQTGTFKITIEVSDPSRKLKPGMFGRVSIVHDMHANALQVPRTAVIDDAGQSAVFVINDGIAERRIIATGFSENGRIEILHGIDDSDQVVIVGQTTLKSGSRVSVINENSGAATAAGNGTAGS
jgi:membrane fusion protein (multidrug efflux system)